MPSDKLSRSQIKTTVQSHCALTPITTTPYVHAGGTILERELGPGEALRVDTGCIVALDASVDYDVQFVGGVKSAIFGGEGFFFARPAAPPETIDWSVLPRVELEVEKAISLRPDAHIRIAPYVGSMDGMTDLMIRTAGTRYCKDNSDCKLGEKAGPFTVCTGECD